MELGAAFIVAEPSSQKGTPAPEIDCHSKVEFEHPVPQLNLKIFVGVAPKSEMSVIA